MTNAAATKARREAGDICQECVSTEFIQTHHEIPGDDSTIVVLCGECHSRKHPDVPKALFLSVHRQFYWFNKSASSLARQLGVHPRTVIRAAKRLEILPGDLSPWDEELIRKNIPKLSWGKPKPRKMHQRQLVRERRAPVTEFTIITDAFLSLPKAAKQLGKPKVTLYRWIEANKLIAVTFGGILFIPVSEVERLKEINEKAAEDAGG